MPEKIARGRGGKSTASCLAQAKGPSSAPRAELIHQLFTWIGFLGTGLRPVRSQMQSRQ